MVFAAQREERVQPLVGAGARVHEMIVGLHGSRQHLEQRELADVRVGDRLEDECERLAIRVGSDVLRCRAGRDLDAGPVGGRRADLADEVGETVDRHVRRCRSADDREDARSRDANRERVLELRRRRHIAFEEAFEHFVVGHDDAFDEVVVHLVLERRELVGDLALGVRAPLVEKALVGEQIGDAAEARLFADRELERRNAGAELRPELVEGALEVGTLPVELVDEDHAGQVQLRGDPPDRLGLHLDAIDRADHEHRKVGHPQRGMDVADEVGVARGVDEVDLVALPLERGQRQRQAQVPLLLLGLEVTHRGAVLDATRSGDRSRSEQERLSERGLARSGVPDKRHIADLGRRIGLQRTPSRWRPEPHPSRSGQRSCGLRPPDPANPLVP